MIFIDGHVHVWPTYDLKLFFEAAFTNFNAVATPLRAASSSLYVLMVAELPGLEMFCTLTENLKKQEQAGTGPALLRTQPGQGILLSHKNFSSPMLLVPGKQLVTSELLEVLSFMSVRTISPGLTLPETVNAVLSAKGIAVLPWGAGKWLGKRGSIMKRYLAVSGTGKRRGVLLGDNGNRPWFWPKSGIYRFARLAGTSVLPGTDTLELKHDFQRVGSFGAWLDVNADRQDPLGQLRRLLSSESSRMVPYGKPMGTVNFVRSQLSLRRKKGELAKR